MKYYYLSMVALISHFAKEVLEVARRKALRATTGAVSARAQELVAEIHGRAFAVIENYWTSKQCDEAIREIDRLCECREELAGRWVDAMQSDHRFFRAERHAQGLCMYVNDPLIEEVRRAYTGRTRADKFVLAARLEYRQGNAGSGGGWHMDSPHSRQFKAILYLSDVNASNGPFELIPGTHRNTTLWRLVLCGLRKPNQYRFTNSEIERICKSDLKPRQFTGSRGTLILVDVTAIHRGTPIEAGNRYALTLYCGDPFLSENGA